MTTRCISCHVNRFHPLRFHLGMKANNFLHEMFGQTTDWFIFSCYSSPFLPKRVKDNQIYKEVISSVACLHTLDFLKFLREVRSCSEAMGEERPIRSNCIKQPSQLYILNLTRHPIELCLRLLGKSTNGIWKYLRSVSSLNQNLLMNRLVLPVNPSISFLLVL